MTTVLEEEPLQVSGDVEEEPLQVTAGPEEEPLQVTAGPEEEPLQVTAGVEEEPLQVSGGQEEPLRATMEVPDIAQENEVFTRQPNKVLGDAEDLDKPGQYTYSLIPSITVSDFFQQHLSHCLLIFVRADMPTSS